MLLNLSRNTNYQIMAAYKANGSFEEGKTHYNKSPVTELTVDQVTILYSIITGYYKKNTVPRYANELKSFVTENRLDQLEKEET